MNASVAHSGHGGTSVAPNPLIDPLCWTVRAELNACASNGSAQETVDALKAKSLIDIEDGTAMVPLEGYFQRQTKEEAEAGEKPKPAKMIVQKKEGGFLYGRHNNT